MPFRSPIDGSLQPDDWSGPRYFVVRNPFFDYGTWSRYINQGETPAAIGTGYEWANPGASLYGIPTVAPDGRITYQRTWSENPNDQRPLVPAWSGNESGNYVDANSAPEWIVKPNPAYLEWGSHLFALHHPQEYGATQSDPGFIGELGSFLANPLMVPIYAAGAAYLGSTFYAADAVTPPGALAESSATPAIEGNAIMEGMDWYSVDPGPDPFATTADVNSGWSFNGGYSGVDWYNNAGIGEAAQSSGLSLNEILSNVSRAVKGIGQAMTSGSAAIAQTRNNLSQQQPNFQRAAGSINLGLLAAGLLAWKLL